MAEFNRYRSIYSHEELMARLKRLADWHLEYLRDGEIFHHDLYDYLLRNTKERLKSARASYLQQELRYTIDLIRSLMRGVDVVVIVKNLREKLDK